MMVVRVQLLILWSGLLVLVLKGVDWCMLFGTGLFCLGRLVFWGSVSADDVALWPYSPGLLVKWVSFLGSLHWPVDGLDLGVGGISYVELLILYELWAGERLSLERAVPRYLRHGRPIFSVGCSVWSRH